MTDIKVLAVWSEQLLWPQRRGLSHLPLPVPTCSRKEKASVGALLEQAGGRGGRKDAQGLSCWGATVLHHWSEDHSLSAQGMDSMFVPEDALLATGSRARTRQLSTHPACPPQVSPFPLENLIACTYFSFFFLLPRQKSSLSIRPVQKQHPYS